MVTDPLHRNVDENLAKYIEQCDAMVVTTDPIIPFLLPERGNHDP